MKKLPNRIKKWVCSTGEEDTAGDHEAQPARANYVHTDRPAAPSAIDLEEGMLSPEERMPYEGDFNEYKPPPYVPRTDDGGEQGQRGPVSVVEVPASDHRLEPTTPPPHYDDALTMIQQNSQQQ